TRAFAVSPGPRGCRPRPARATRRPCGRTGWPGTRSTRRRPAASITRGRAAPAPPRAAPRREYHPVAFVEPAAGFEDGVLGLDVGAWLENRAAMDRARDSGQPPMSERLGELRAAG